MLLVRIPLWKAYLYSLMERIRIYVAVNTQTYNFGFNRDDKFLLKCMFKKYTQKGGGYREIRSLRYLKLINAVRVNMGFATQDELEIVNRLAIITKIHLEDLMNFEIKQLKELAKEVGINAIAASKMKPEELAKSIIKAVDPKKSYSTEFVKWYDAIPDSFLNTIEVAGGGSEEGGAAVADIIEAVTACTKMQELKDLLADETVAPMVAGFDISKYKLAGPLKKALVEFLNTPAESQESGESGGDDAKMEIAKAVMEAKSDDELVAVIEAANELFTSFEPGEVTDLDQMKELIIAHLGVTLEEKKAPLSLKDKLKQKKEAEAAKKEPEASGMVIDFDPTPGNFDAEAIYEKADGLKIGDLKKFYSQVAKITNIEMASNKVGVTKDILMDNLANALTDLAANGPKAGACECPASEGDIEITKQLVEDAAKAEDKDTLVAMCEKLGIALNPLEKRNVNRMKDKLLAKVPEGEVKKAGKLGLLKKGAAKEEPSAPPAESKLVEIFAIVEKMVLDKAEEKDIIAAVTPLYKELGKSALAIRGRVKILIEVVQVDHNLKK